jgi:hypothetical protein
MTFRGHYDARYACHMGKYLLRVGSQFFLLGSIPVKA